MNNSSDISRILTNNRYITDSPEFKFIEREYSKHGLSIGVNMQELYALNSLLECCLVTSKELLILLFDFIKSDDKHSTYLKSICRQANTIKKNVYYKQFRVEIGKIYKSGTLDKENTLRIIKTVISILHGSYLGYAISTYEVLRFVNMVYRANKLYHIEEISSRIDRELDIEKLMNIWVDILRQRYDIVKLEVTDDAMKDLYNTMKSLSRKNAHVYFKKCTLMDITDTSEFREELVIQYSLEVAYILSRVKSIKEIKDGQVRKLIQILNEFGINSKQLDNYIIKITSNEATNKLTELRRSYKYITPDILSDDSILSWDKLKLAKLNYEIKNRRGGLK